MITHWAFHPSAGDYYLFYGIGGEQSIQRGYKWFFHSQKVRKNEIMWKYYLVLWITNERNENDFVQATPSLSISEGPSWTVSKNEGNIDISGNESFSCDHTYIPFASVYCSILILCK